jgi:hypothetical protein
MGGEALAVHREAGWWPAHADAYGADVRARVERSQALSADDLDAAAVLRQQLRADVDALLDDVDVLLLPVASCGPSRTASPDEQPDGAGPLRSAVLRGRCWRTCAACRRAPSGRRRRRRAAARRAGRGRPGGRRARARRRRRPVAPAARVTRCKAVTA